MKDKNGKSLSAFVTQYSEHNTFKGILLNEGLNDQANFICTKKQTIFSSNGRQHQKAIPRGCSLICCKSFDHVVVARR